MQKKILAVSLIAATTMLSASVLAQSGLTNVQTGFNPSQAVIGGQNEGCVVTGQTLNGQPQLINCGGTPVAAPAAVPAPVAAAPAAAPAITRVTLKTDVLFDTDKSVIKSDQMNGLREIARQLQALKSFDGLTVAGNADYRGGTAYNQRLSERRALAVGNALVANGVPANKIRATGNGEAQPLVGQAGCRGKRGRALSACLAPDRRVDIDVVNAIK